MEINLLISLAGILGAGLSAYVGVRVALAEVKGELKHHGEYIDQHAKRLDRLESRYFKE